MSSFLKLILTPFFPLLFCGAVNEVQTLCVLEGATPQPLVPNLNVFPQSTSAFAHKCVRELPLRRPPKVLESHQTEHGYHPLLLRWRPSVRTLGSLVGSSAKEGTLVPGLGLQVPCAMGALSLQLCGNAGSASLCPWHWQGHGVPQGTGPGPWWVPKQKGGT